MKKRSDYETEAFELAKACDITIEALEKFLQKIWCEKTVLQVQNCYFERKDFAFNPSSEYKNIAT